MVECFTLKGEKVLVPQDQLSLRLSVYGVVLWEASVLLIRGRTSGRLWFPGGGLIVGEQIGVTLARELKEETGVEVQPTGFLAFREEFFYHDVWKKAFHSFRFYFLCHPLSVALVADDRVADGESERPRWFGIESLSPSSLDQDYGFEILQLALKRS